MRVVPNNTGQLVTMYDNLQELYYNLFFELGVFVNESGYIQDSDTNIQLKFRDMYIKVSLNDMNEAYAGKTEILFDPPHNFALASNLMGFYIDKREHSDNPVNYLSQGIVDRMFPDDIMRHQVFVKTGNGEYESNFYRNSYLCFIDCIFRMGGSVVDLSNLDLLER